MIKLHISEWPFNVTNPKHTCAIILNQHLYMPHLSGGCFILQRRSALLTCMDFNKFTPKI